MSLRSLFSRRSQRSLQAEPPPKYEPARPSAPEGSDPYRDPAHVPHYRSRFGGNWTDLSNALEIAAGKRALGLVSDAEHELLRHWIGRGYVILRRAIRHDWIDEHNADIEAVWRNGHPSAWVSAIEDGRGVTRPLQIGDFEKTDNLVKLIDVYEYLESARRLAFAPAVQRFLELVFERPPLAHQSLSFYRGSKQPIHQDTVFVRVSSPLELTASWIALEDVQPGSGELEYYEGSHGFPEFLFDGRYKWLAPGNTQLGDYYEHLRRCAEQRGLEPVRFQPQKGDVLIWSADLAHGGSPYTDSTRTRRSLVTHYTPVDCHVGIELDAMEAEVSETHLPECHMRWPEALGVVESIWKTLPERYKYNHQLRRLEIEFGNWDCARDSNEGVRAQDILPLLLERFHFEVFCSFANVIDTFIDRSCGPNFDPDLEDDREFVDRIARLDEELIDTGVVKPTHMIAALRSRPVGRTSPTSTGRRSSASGILSEAPPETDEVYRRVA